ncbi:MAG: hypothetical protein AAB368_13070 [bacterium]|jgi:hypothetical protein
MKPMIVAVAVLAACPLEAQAGNDWPAQPYNRPGALYVVVPSRRIDTRIPGPAVAEYPKPGESLPQGGPLVDGERRGYLIQGVGPVGGPAVIPLGALAAIVTVTAVGATRDGYLFAYDPTVSLYAPYPPPPTASTLNFRADGGAVASTTFVALGQIVGQEVGLPFLADFAIYTRLPGGGTVHVIVDLIGYVMPAPAP